MNRLQEKYIQQVIPEMRKRFSYRNSLAVPKLSKVVLNVGIPSSKNEAKFQELVADVLTRISGQRPVFTRAKKSISSFKIREGMVVGASVTLRKQRMYEFIDKLVNLALPNVRDFRGISKKSLDKTGNLTLGFKEYLPFPEINPDEVENVFGLEVCITTTAKSKEEAFVLLSLLGFPFIEKLADSTEQVKEKN